MSEVVNHLLKEHEKLSRRYETYTTPGTGAFGAAEALHKRMSEIEKTLAELSDSEQLRAEATAKCADLTIAVASARASAFGEAAQLVEGWEKTMQPGMLLNLAFEQVAAALRARAQEGR